MAQWFTNLARNHEVVGSIPGLAQWVTGKPPFPPAASDCLGTVCIEGRQAR